MPRYRLCTKAFIDGVLFRGGEIIEKPIDWKGPTGDRRLPRSASCRRMATRNASTTRPNLYRLLNTGQITDAGLSKLEKQIDTVQGKGPTDLRRRTEYSGPAAEVRR